MIVSITKMNACSVPVTTPSTMNGSGATNGTMLPMIATTISSPNTLPKRRSDSDSTRDAWLMSSMISTSGAIQSGAPGITAKCFR